MVTCPICSAEIAPESGARSRSTDLEATLARAPSGKRPLFPFCSERCRTIDLGRWLDGEYRVPVAPEEDEDGDGEPSDPEDA
ncbi:MAG: DNA gyrase inhibitor YacG [Polyangiaceae bacterium]